MSVKTQGTQLFIIDEDAPGGAAVLAIKCVTSLDGLGAPREQLETTCLEADAREYVGGLSTPGQITVNLNFDPSNDSHYRLYELWKENKSFKAAIGFSNLPGVPSIDSAGEFDFPTTRDFIAFEGYVVDLPINIALNAVVTAAVPIQVSGEYNIFKKVA